MSIESLLYTRLSTYAGLALVSDRIYPLILPQECVLPAISYQRVATQPRESCMAEDAGIARPRFQITAWDSTFDGVRDLAEQVRGALQRWQDSANDIIDSFLVMEIDGYDPETLEYSSILDFEIVHTEVV
jgi:hypothetical protein